MNEDEEDEERLVLALSFVDSLGEEGVAALVHLESHLIDLHTEYERVGAGFGEEFVGGAAMFCSLCEVLLQRGITEEQLMHQVHVSVRSHELGNTQRISNHVRAKLLPLRLVPEEPSK